MHKNDHLPFDVEPEVSVIIASMSEDAAFSVTMQSCLDQEGVDLEIVSFIKDASFDILSPMIQKKHTEGKKITILRGNDCGIADAWNQAVEHASGRLLVFLGAGDVFLFTRCIENLLKAATKSNDISENSVIIGMQFIRNNDNSLHYWKPCGDPSGDGLLHGMAIPHASSFWPRSLLKVEKFDRNFKIALDYEYALRVRKNVKYVEIACPVAIIEPGGLSNKPSRMIQIIREDARARRKNCLPSRYINKINFKRFVRWVTGV